MILVSHVQSWLHKEALHGGPVVLVYFMYYQQAWMAGRKNISARHKNHGSRPPAGFGFLANPRLVVQLALYKCESAICICKRRMWLWTRTCMTTRPPRRTHTPLEGRRRPQIHIVPWNMLSQFPQNIINITWRRAYQCSWRVVWNPEFKKIIFKTLIGRAHVMVCFLICIPINVIVWLSKLW